MVAHLPDLGSGDGFLRRLDILRYKLWIGSLRTCRVPGPSPPTSVPLAQTYRGLMRSTCPVQFDPRLMFYSDLYLFVPRFLLLKNQVCKIVKGTVAVPSTCDHPAV